jgi:CTP synthase (UTP-ammonia lyase)
MKQTASIAIIGDFNPKWDHHLMIDESLRHAASQLKVELEPHWIPTESIDDNSQKLLEGFDGIWISSGSPYRSMDGALRSIQFAREKNRPFFAT